MGKTFILIYYNATIMIFRNNKTLTIFQSKHLVIDYHLNNSALNLLNTVELNDLFPHKNKEHKSTRHLIITISI